MQFMLSVPASLSTAGRESRDTATCIYRWLFRFIFARHCPPDTAAVPRTIEETTTCRLERSVDVLWRLVLKRRVYRWEKATNHGFTVPSACS